MKKFLLILMAFTLVFSVAACQDSEPTDDPNNGGNDNGDETDAYVQGISDDLVIVGNTAATSGVFAPVGTPFNSAIKEYFNMVNEDGGIAGREIRFIHYDDEFDGDTGRTYTERLVEQDKVFALVGHFGTPTVGATHDYLTDLGVPRVYYATGISALYNPDATGYERSSFPVQPIYDAEGEVFVARAVSEFNAQKIGVIYTNDDAGEGMLNGIERRADMLDVTLTKYSMSAGETPSSQALNVVNDDVDAVIVAANQNPFIAAAKALYAADNTKPVLTSYVSASAGVVEQLENEVLNGSFDLYASAWVNIFNDQGGLSEGYQQFAAQVPDYADNAYAMAGWIAAHFFVEGLKRVGDDELTWDSYIDAMEEDPISNPMGGIVDYADGSRVGTRSMALLKASITQDGDEYVYEWANYLPIEDINTILE